MVWLAAASTSASNDLFGSTDDLLRLLFLAFGGALVVGNVLALVRPPQRGPGSDPDMPLKPPMARCVTMIVIGMVAVIWAVATLTS
jgi:hypothetical protein